MSYVLIVSSFTHFLVCYIVSQVLSHRIESHLINPCFSMCKMKITSTLQSCQWRFINERMTKILVKGSAHKGYSIMYYILISSSCQKCDLCKPNKEFDMVLISKWLNASYLFLQNVMWINTTRLDKRQLYSGGMIIYNFSSNSTYFSSI